MTVIPTPKTAAPDSHELANYLVSRGIDNESAGYFGPCVIITPAKRDEIVAALRPRCDVQTVEATIRAKIEDTKSHVKKCAFNPSEPAWHRAFGRLAAYNEILEIVSCPVPSAEGK